MPEGADVTKYVHLVFSDPPAGVTEDEFNEWYDAHVQEILAVDGWVAATRYRIAPEVGADESGMSTTRRPFFNRNRWTGKDGAGGRLRRLFTGIPQT